MNSEHSETHSRYTDKDGDRVTITWHPSGRPYLFTGQSGVALEREQVLDLYHRLGEYLMAHPAEGLATEQADRLPNDYTGSVAEEAHVAVYGDRQDDYGHPREDFTRTAVIWTGLLQHKLAEGAYIEAEDIARCQIGVKLARDVHSAKRDNRVDMAGYAITLDRLETGR